MNGHVGQKVSGFDLSKLRIVAIKRVVEFSVGVCVCQAQREAEVCQVRNGGSGNLGAVDGGLTCVELRIQVFGGAAG